MPKDILMPALAAGMEEGHLVRWLKKEGEPVKRGDLLAEIETEKAVMEMEAEADGRLGPILVGGGSHGVAVGTLLASILTEGEVAPALAEHAPSLAALVRVRKVVASPLARRVADDYGVDLSALSGSGPGGRIVRVDVERARAAAPSTALPPRPTAPAATAHLAHGWLREGKGRPLVLVHGFGSDLNGWRPFLAGADFGRPVLGIDLPGHGGSAGHGATRFEDIVQAVGDTLESLDLPGIDVLAHSLGAAVSVALAGEGRLDMRSLFLLSPAGLGPEINGAFVNGLARARSAESLAPWLGETVADPAIISPAFLQASAAARADGSLGHAQQRLAAFLFPDGTQAFGVRAALAQLSIPVAIVFGADDQVIPTRHARSIPGMVALHLFPGVGHMPHLEIRDAVWRLLARHLRSAA